MSNCDKQLSTPVTFHLGMEIQRDRAQHTQHLSQKKYATGLVINFGLSEAKS